MNESDLIVALAASMKLRDSLKADAERLTMEVAQQTGQDVGAMMNELSLFFKAGIWRSLQFSGVDQIIQAAERWSCAERVHDFLSATVEATYGPDAVSMVKDRLEQAV